LSAEEKRFYILPIVGSGTREDPYRPLLPSRIVTRPDGSKVNELAVSWVAVIPSDLTTGKPLHKVALVKAKGTPEKHTAIKAMTHDPIDLESDVRGSPSEVLERKNALLAKLKERGKPTKFTSPLELEEDEAEDMGRVLNPKMKGGWLENFDVS